MNKPIKDVVETFKSSLTDLNVIDDDDYALPDRHEILPGLWLGCQPSTIEPDLKYVLSLNGATSYGGKNYPNVVRAYFEDSLTLPDVGYLHALVDLGIALWKNGPTLVHCAAGMNRSGLIVGLMLVRNGNTAQAALELMRTKRSNGVLHNPTFRNYLLSQ